MALSVFPPRVDCPTFAVWLFAIISAVVSTVLAMSANCCSPLNGFFSNTPKNDDKFEFHIIVKIVLLVWLSVSVLKMNLVAVETIEC